MSYLRTKKLIIPILILYISVKLPRINSNNIIEIPFKKKYQLKEHLTESSVIKYLKDNVLLTEISLGTPYQRLFFNLRTDIQYTYVLPEDPTFEEMETPEDLIGFKVSKSSTFKKSNRAYIVQDIMPQAWYINENIKINEIEIKNISLILAEDLYQFEQITTDSGVLGIGTIILYESDSQSSNFIKNLKEHDLIQSYDFFFEFENATNGKLIIGSEPNQYNSNKYPNKINSYARGPSYGQNILWGFNIDYVTYNRNKIDANIPYAIMQIEYGLIGVGKAIKDILDINFFNELLNKGICKLINISSSSYYVCIKDKFDKNKIGILGIYNFEFKRNFEIDLRDLFFDYENNSYFMAEFKPMMDKIILGEMFIRNNTIIFNQDKKLVGIYQEIKSEIIGENTNSNKSLITAIAIVSFAFILITIVLVYLFIYKKRLIPRKKRITELVDQNYEYTPMN